jgi:hypothetical protein
VKAAAGSAVFNLRSACIIRTPAFLSDRSAFDGGGYGQIVGHFSALIVRIVVRGCASVRETVYAKRDVAHPQRWRNHGHDGMRLVGQVVETIHPADNTLDGSEQVLLLPDGTRQNFRLAELRPANESERRRFVQTLIEY